jgi:hypothetical protein
VIRRILPPEEWHRLEATEAATIWQQLKPENTQVVVVEDSGVIVGAWVMLRTVHAECLWIAPEHRGSFGVAKRLLKGMRDVAAAWGASRVVTGSVSPHVNDLIRRFGGVPMPCESFVLPVKMERPSNKDLGHAFHEQLAALTPEGIHPEDPQHDEEVGRALRTAIEGEDPDGAMNAYNSWASGAGYEQIEFLGTLDGKLLADIRTAIIEVDSKYGVRVLKQEGVCQP